MKLKITYRRAGGSLATYIYTLPSGESVRDFIASLNAGRSAGRLAAFYSRDDKAELVLAFPASDVVSIEPVA